MDWRERLRRLLPGAWLGLLLGVALLATPAPFAVLERPLVGRVVAWIFAREAATSVVLAMLLLMIERRRALDAWQAGEGASQFSAPMVGALVALACTLLGYYGLQPAMEQARTGGPTMLSFGQLHAVSLGLFAVKICAVAALAWGATGAAAAAGAMAGDGPVSPPASS